MHSDALSGSRARLGKVSAEAAKEHVLNEYEKFQVKQDRLFVSDLDELLAADNLFAEIQRAENEKD